MLNAKKRREYQKQWRKRNARRVCEYQKKWQAEHREMHLAYRRRTQIKKLYGLNPEQYNSLIANGCQICGSTDKLHVDHDHKTTRVRGALCQHCNRGLGGFKDNLDLLKAAVRYLRANS